jgi:hypothetical protein
MLRSIPLLVIPLILYNLVLAGADLSADPDPWAGELLSFGMMSGGVFSMSYGDGLIVLALILLFIEVIKSTRTSNLSIIDHLLSTFVFVAFVVEFLLVRGAAHPVFFILMVITLVDLLAGFSVSIRSASRDVNFG